MLVVLVGAALLSGCAVPADATDDAVPAGNSAVVEYVDPGLTEEMTSVQIADIQVPGPASGRDPGLPNLVGSASIPVRVYEPEGEPWAELVWAHGGSFVYGNLDWPEADWVSRSFSGSPSR